MQLHYNSSDTFIKKIILGCVTLQEKYRPTWFCLLSPWVNVLVMLIKEKLAPRMEIKVTPSLLYFLVLIQMHLIAISERHYYMS